MAAATNVDKTVEFQKTRGTITEVYTDTFDALNRVQRGANKGYGARTYESAAAFRTELARAENDPQALIALSRKFYAQNPIYASMVNYYANLFT